MAQSELKYQKQLVDVAKSNGGYGLKMNNRFVGGIPDLLLKVKEWHFTYFIEIKHEDFKRVPNTVKLKLTPLQRIEIKKMQDAGMFAGWAVFITQNGKDPIVVSGSNYDVTEINIEESDCVVWDKQYSTLCEISRGVHHLV